MHAYALCLKPYVNAELRAQRLLPSCSNETDCTGRPYINSPFKYVDKKLRVMNIYIYINIYNAHYSNNRYLKVQAVH